MIIQCSGNIGREPYLSWYGFSYHTEWCANVCGYIENGLCPSTPSLRRVFSSSEPGADGLMDLRNPLWYNHLFWLGYAGWLLQTTGRQSWPHWHCGKGGERSYLHCRRQLRWHLPGKCLSGRMVSDSWVRYSDSGYDDVVKTAYGFESALNGSEIATNIASINTALTKESTDISLCFLSGVYIVS